MPYYLQKLFRPNFPTFFKKGLSTSPWQKPMIVRLCRSNSLVTKTRQRDTNNAEMIKVQRDFNACYARDIIDFHSPTVGTYFFDISIGKTELVSFIWECGNYSTS